MTTLSGLRAKSGYLARSAAAWTLRRGLACPNCGATEATVEARKFVVTALRRCRRCALLFRTPTDGEAFSRRFYDRLYRQGHVTALPDEAALAAMLATGFAGTPLDQSRYVDCVRALGLGAPRLFELGCSWGYGTVQFRRAGIDAVGYEVAEGRRRFAAARLAVPVVDTVGGIDARHPLAGSFDVFFSAHVIEHVPQPGEAIALAWTLLRDGGWFLSVTPNGSAPCRATFPDWNRHWGAVHPNFIDDRFLAGAFGRSPRLFASGGWPSAIAGFAAAPAGERRADALEGPELLFLARKSAAAGGW
ncbi:MAG: class I SAM-dependent methyltransferase [Alphaproteobacteria bacterium]